MDDKTNKAIGNLLDRWELMANDVKSWIEEQDESFYKAVETLMRIRLAS